VVANGADLALLAVQNLLPNHGVEVHKLELVTQTLTSLVEKRKRKTVKNRGEDNGSGAYLISVCATPAEMVHLVKQVNIKK
jgi:hypothetical protein